MMLIQIEFPSGNAAWEATIAGDFDMMCEHWPSYTEEIQHLLQSLVEVVK